MLTWLNKKLMLRKTYENIDSIGRAILTIEAKDVHNKELAEVIYPDGKKAFAQVIALNGTTFVTCHATCPSTFDLPLFLVFGAPSKALSFGRHWS